MRRQNLRRKTIDEEPINGEDLFERIRYLDPDLDHRRGDLIGIIVLLLVVFLICAVGLSLHFRGL
jgi:hypothetical protein